ncbi:MAG: dihydroorotase [Desulfocapsaceae bacterium]|nr:dihydroorotase [Desulfocapsaceae bacterium]
MKISIESPLDMHLHLRQGDMLKQVLPFSAAHFAGAVIMPNLVSPVDDGNKLLRYRDEIVSCCPDEIFKPYMTLFFRTYSRQELEDLGNHIIGIKLYPAGITTGSESGVADFSAIEETLSHMQDAGIPLLVHGESNGFVMDREKEFLATYEHIARTFPGLHIIMEHITSADSVEFLDKFENVSATVTVHHLMITLDDVMGDLLEPDLFCKPVAKTPRDRQALQSAVFSGHPKLMFGSDSAPHPRHHKECCGCAAGIFSAPVALPLLADLFDKEDRLDLLQEFVSGIARKRYNIKPPEKTITLENKEYKVPDNHGTVRSFLAGRTLSWRVVNSDD